MLRMFVNVSVIVSKVNVQEKRANQTMAREMKIKAKVVRCCIKLI